MSDAAPEASARAALEFVKDGQTLGLGTGRAAEAFVRALGAGRSATHLASVVGAHQPSNSSYTGSHLSRIWGSAGNSSSTSSPHR